MALDYQPMFVPLAVGLDQEQDERAKSQPLLDIAVDVEFDAVGGLRTRKPFIGISSDKAEGGTINDFRRVVDNGGELVAFTSDSIYAYSEKLSAWVRKGTHLAIASEERTVFANPTDQKVADRAELGGVVFWAWTESTAAGSVAKIAAIDAETAAVIYGPVALATSTMFAVRLCALATRVLLFTRNGSTLDVYALDPADPGAGITAGATAIGGVSSWNTWDAVKVPGADQAVLAGKRTTTTSYSMASVTAGLTVATATVARPCDGPIAVSCPPTGGTVQVVRADGTHVEADLITISGFVDTAHVNLVLTSAAGTVINQIAACHRSTQDSGQYRCYAFWSADESDSGSDQFTDAFATRYTYVDTGGNTGAVAVLAAGLGVASRAFERAGHVYVHLTFEGESILNRVSGTAIDTALRAQIQNTYFLYRDDKHLCAKIADEVGGGYAEALGILPHVQDLGAGRYAWAAIERRRVPIGDEATYQGYADRGIREVLLSFDDDRARRTARIGQTLYVSGAEIRQYDGSALVELGSHLQPWWASILQGVGGDLEDGTYSYRLTYRWDNARGERDRSSSFLTIGLLIVAGPDKAEIAVVAPLRPTHKPDVAVEVWRTAKDVIEAPFALVTSPDPAADTDPNRYLTNPDPDDPSFVDTLDDSFDDEALGTKEQWPESNADVLQALAPPPANILIASDTRVFLADVAGDPDKIWYSKQRNDGEVVAFNDALTVPVPIAGGAMTGLAFLNETLIAFRATAVYALPGDGYSNVGAVDGSQNYGPARTLSSDLGAVSQEAIATTPAGLVFKSRKGWYLLNRGFALDYIGGPVRNYDGETVRAVHVVEGKHQIRILLESRLLVFDYRRNQWGEWSIGGAAAVIWQGTYGVLDSDELALEADDYVGVDYGLDVETAWVKVGDPQGRAKVRNVLALGEVMSACRLRVRVARDYVTDGAGGWDYYDDKTTNDVLVVGDTLQFRHGPSRKECEAIKVRLTAVGAVSGTPTGEAVRLTGLTLEVGQQRGVTKRLGAAMKQ